MDHNDLSTVVEVTEPDPRDIWPTAPPTPDSGIYTSWRERLVSTLTGGRHGGHMFSTLRTRLIVSFASLLVLSLVLVGGILILLLQNYNRDLVLKQLALLTIPVEQQVHGRYSLFRQSGGVLDAGQLLESLHQQTRDTGVSIVLAGNDSRIFSQVGLPLNTPPRAQMNLGAQLPINQGGRRFYNGTLTIRGQQYLYVVDRDIGLQTSDPQSLDLYLYLLKPVRDVDNHTLADLIGRLLLAGLISLLLSFAIAAFLVRTIARPLQQMRVAAEGVALGDYDRPLPVETPDEIGDLARSFRQMAVDVQRTTQVQKDLVANVSHELRSPLTSISGFSQAILDGSIQDQTGVQRAAEIIHTESNRLIRMVQELLDLARLQAGQMLFHRVPVDLAGLTRDIAEHYTVRTQEKHQVLDVQVPPAAPELLVDPDRTRQVVGNLLDNAVKFTPGGGHIVVRVWSDIQNVSVSVANEGPGIPPERLARLFERFYQLDQARSREGGVGLGLAIAKELAEAQGGRLTASSQEGWTVFTVAFPR